MEKSKLKSHLLKLAILIAAVFSVAIISGCTNELTDIVDINGLFFEYSVVSNSDERYIVITKHIVSQSDVIIPETIYDIPVKAIGESAFEKEKQLQSVKLGGNTQIIEENAFGGCENLESIEFTDSIISIKNHSFQNCTSLKSVNITQNIKNIGRGAFYGCSNLSEVTFSGNPSNIGGRAFADTAWLNSMRDRKFVTICDGILIQYNGDDSQVKLPKSIKQISGAFAGNTKVEEISLNSGLQKIGDMSFMGCTSLSYVGIPKSVTDIGDEAFYGCTAMENISLSDTIQNIGKDAFSYCNAKLYAPRNTAAHKYFADNNLQYSFSD